MSKDISFYKSLFPQRITVKIEKNDGGLWAEIVEIPFCYTQASSGSELIEMINDAIQTHFEVPENYKNDVGYYLPITKEHERIEEMLRNLIKIEQKVSAGVEIREIFNKTAATIC